MIPLRDLFIFPGETRSIIVGRAHSIGSLEHSAGNNELIVLATQIDPGIEDIAPQSFYAFGVTARIRKSIKNLDNSYNVLLEGIQRVAIKDVFTEEELIRCIYEAEEKAGIVSQGYLWLLDDINALLESHPDIRTRYNIGSLRGDLAEKTAFIDLAASKLPLAINEKFDFIRTLDADKRAELLYGFLLKEIKKAEISRNIKDKIKERIEKTEKEFFIKQQIKALKEELGQEADLEEEKESLKETIDSSSLSKEAKERAKKEYKRLSGLPFFSPEVGIIRNYIDWLLSLPWTATKKEKTDLDFAFRVLEKHHYGLEKIKERIIEHLAVERLSRRSRPTIICFVGAPGTGKTSLARSIAEATNREFVRVSLGGIRDEAEIRGHRMTYIGSMPGRIIQSMRKVKSNNPVFLLDEIDKLSFDFRGDPASALLEVLDPDQNKHFSDNYLEVEYDLSNVMFITTANTLDIPKPLMDRMEIIQLEGYTDIEKLKIAGHFLIDRSLKALGLEKDDIRFSDDAVYEIIHHYTREAGLRNLQREIENVLRKLARKKVETKKKIRLEIKPKQVQEYLGIPKFHRSPTFLGRAVGEATGLAWTPQGGDVLSIEVIITRGNGKIIMTGTLGEVMKESAQTALSYVKKRIEKDKKADLDKRDVHIHIPEGAVPKEGPSAGVTLVTAIYSAFCNTPVNKEIAMTGEITLKGRILPVGGIKTKILAAHRRGIHQVIVPADNKRDLAELDKYITKKMKIHLFSNIDEIFDLVLSHGNS